MSAPDRTITLVCLNPKPEDGEGEIRTPPMPNFGIRRVQAALVANPRTRGIEVCVVEREEPDVDAFVEAIEATAPNIVGFSVYVWSFATLLEVARRVARPGRLIVFGGPSARPAMFELEPNREGSRALDALCLREGEEAIVDLACLPAFGPDDLMTVAGLAVRAGEGFQLSPARSSTQSMDALASPYRLDLMPRDEMGYLETYRGCPLSCRFCEWGDWKGAGRVMSLDPLVDELRAVERYDPSSVFLLDAALNLNARAFRLLKAADERTGFFARRNLSCEVYPSFLTDEHLEFLGKAKSVFTAVGLQSFNEEVLAAMDRRMKVDRFDACVRDLATLGTVEIQIILGLPMENPESFRATFERVRRLPCQTRVYHCLVLPDALMTRGLPSFELRFDPTTLRMTSCNGWSAADLEKTRSWLADAVQAERGYAGPFWWAFPGPADPPRRDAAGGETSGTSRRSLPLVGGRA